MKTYYAIGLMSGTSLDGVDLVYVKFDVTDTYSYKIIFAETIAYSSKWKKKLKDAFHFDTEKLNELSIEYANLLSELIIGFIDKNNIDYIDFMASHGHTIHHQPEKGYTLQIGDGKIINNRTKIKTICDFRTQDVLLGGQGAPLVPIGDALLFHQFDYCLNLGGFANISLDDAGKRIAYDICPVNIVLNHYVHQLKKEYDDRGNIAKSGNIHFDLLQELNALSFYFSEQPKSLGYEFVVAKIFPIIDKYDLPVSDILRTYVEHVAIQIANKISPKKSVLITGGGAFNDFLIHRITQLSKANIIIPDTVTIDFKEALIFALLGLRKIENKINCLQSVTGAKKDHCSGVVFLS